MVSVRPMLATDWHGALWTLLGLPILYVIGVVLFKSEKHGDKVRSRKPADRRAWDKPWVGSPPKALGKHAREMYYREDDEDGEP
jgi:hypothetical protein